LPKPQASTLQNLVFSVARYATLEEKKFLADKLRASAPIVIQLEPSYQ
jgi:hypothetical protein